MFRTIIALLYAFCFLVFGSPLLLIERIRHKRHPKESDLRSLRIVQRAFRTIYRICGVRLTVIGQEKIPKDVPVLYVGNHQSYFDIIIGYSLMPDLTGYVAKDSIEKVPLLRGWMRRLHCLFINRENPRESMKTILAAIDHIKNGISICIFPEGTRGDGITLLPFHPGSFKIAEKAKCPIVPMAISNTRNIILNHMPVVKPVHVIIEYGDPIDVNDLSRQEKKELAPRVRDTIQQMVDKNNQNI